MVNEDLGLMYDEVLRYLESLRTNLEDPASARIEFNDLTPFDFSTTIPIIQTAITLRPSLAEASLLRAYRDLRASQFEYDMRRMSRKDYYADALIEQTNDIAKWTYNKNINDMRMTGKGEG